MIERADRATVFVDADNTLWETDKVFADAQLGLLRGVETAIARSTTSSDRLAYVRATDQALAERHHAGLRYPPALLIRALAFQLDGEAAAASVRRALGGLDQPGNLAGRAQAEIERAYMLALRTKPELRPGVAMGLAMLREMNCAVYIVTEGSRPRITKTAQDAGLGAAFDRIIEAPKHWRLFKRVEMLTRTPRPSFMVGDQLQRDIAPAKAAGLTTIYFPGGFRPTWEPEEKDVRPDYRIARFDEVPQIVAASATTSGRTHRSGRQDGIRSAR